jgi:Uma2 family endonuclease
MAVPKLEDEQLFTYADYKAWELAEGERFELIYGVAYAIAGPNAYHQTISGEIFRQIANYLRGKPCKVLSAPFDVRLFFEEDESDDTVVQPDIVVICDKEKRGPEGCRGAPDLVVEVLSPSNSAVEMSRKFILYRQAGVREYWELNPENKILIAHRFGDDQVLTHIYGKADKVPVGIFPDLEIDLEAVFAE